MVGILTLNGSGRKNCENPFTHLHAYKLDPVHVDGEKGLRCMRPQPLMHDREECTAVERKLFHTCQVPHLRLQLTLVTSVMLASKANSNPFKLKQLYCPTKTCKKKKKQTDISHFYSPISKSKLEIDRVCKRLCYSCIKDRAQLTIVTHEQS
jgi:hypothetical protein